MAATTRHPLLAVRAVLRDRSGRILLLRRSRNSRSHAAHWCLPGGMVNAGESPEQAIAREIKEETGLRIRNLRFLFYQNRRPQSDEANHYLNMYFTADCSGSVRLNRESSEHARVSLAEALSYKPVFGGCEALVRCQDEFGGLFSAMQSETTPLVLPWKQEAGDTQELAAVIKSAGFKNMPEEKKSELVSSLVELYLDSNDVNAARKEMVRLRKSKELDAGVIDYLEGRLAISGGEYSRAYQYLNRAVRYLERRNAGDDAFTARRLAAVYESLGRAYLQDCSFGNALIWFERSLLIRIEHKDRYGQARSYGYLRKLHEAASRFDPAIRYCQAQLKLLRSVADSFGEIVAYNSLVELYLAVNEPSRAATALKKARALLALPHLASSRPYVTLGEAQLALFHGDARTAGTLAAGTVKAFSAAGDLEREGKAFLVMAEARGLSGQFGPAQRFITLAQGCFTRANLMRQRSRALLVESRIAALQGDRNAAIAALCESVRLSYEFSGAARGEEVFRDIVQRFLTSACKIAPAAWVSILVKNAGFWKYYHQRTSVRRVDSGYIGGLSEINSALTSAPAASSPVSCELSERHPWSGQLVMAPLINRGSLFGYLMVPAAHAGISESADMLADVGTALGAIYEKKLVQRDGLTDLYNRRHFDMFIEEELQRSRVLRRSLGLIMLDIDHFGQFNKQYGHDVGDVVLCEVANTFRRLMAQFKSRTATPLFQEENAARYGGEEFVAVVEGVSAEEIRDLAAEVRAEIAARHIAVAGRNMQVTASLGVGFCPASGRYERVLKAADEALRLAKNNGRNRVEVKSCGD
jgi:diguanylate cyclase (GGDEF)-like protein